MCFGLLRSTPASKTIPQIDQNLFFKQSLRKIILKPSENDIKQSAS